MFAEGREGELPRSLVHIALVLLLYHMNSPREMEHGSGDMIERNSCLLCWFCCRHEDNIRGLSEPTPRGCEIFHKARQANIQVPQQLTTTINKNTTDAPPTISRLAEPEPHERICEGKSMVPKVSITIQGK